MKIKNFIFVAIMAVVVGFTGNVVTAQISPTPFETDVNSAINDGLQYLRDNSAFTSTSGGYRNTRGLNLLALLEKRSSAITGAATNGYANSATADQGLARDAVTRIISDTSYGVSRSSFYSYYDGMNMMALSLYGMTGGPDISGADYTVRQSIDRLVDRSIDSQLITGFWFYYPIVPASQGDFHNDSSTTQFVVAGLSAAKGFYEETGSDPGNRLFLINATLQKCAGKAGGEGYANHESFGPTINGTALTGGASYTYSEERDYGRWKESSYQQTASGLWCELLGGFGLNETAVQNKLGWLYTMYNYNSTDAADGPSGWRIAYFYYLWSSSKAYSLIEKSGATPSGTNLTTTHLGTLANSSGFPRLLHRNPATDTRPAPRGAGAAGYYLGETQRWYYDYAYRLMELQSSGRFLNPSGTPSYEADHAYALLVLQRALGGVCNTDSDGDGICDDLDLCPDNPTEEFDDADGDGIGDICDACPNTPQGINPSSNPNRFGCPNLPPVVSCADVEVSASVNCSADASVFVSSSDPDVGDVVTLPVQSPPGPYLLGDTLVTVTVSDGTLSAQCSATVTVVDDVNPSITCPGNITLNNTPGTCGAVVTYDVTADDNCSDVIPVQTAGQASGTTFQVGTMTNTFVVTDGEGLTATCSFDVTVVDAEYPTITCPDDIVVNNTPGTCGAEVSYTTPVGEDNCSATTEMTAGFASGTFFPVGTTTVTYEVADSAGLTASCSFTVTVKDVDAPVITCPVDATVECTGTVRSEDYSAGNASAEDNCGTDLTITSSDTSDTTGCGGTMVITRTWTAADSATPPNTASCVQTITVVDTTEPAIDCPDDVTVYLDANCEVNTDPTDTGTGKATGDDTCGIVTISNSDVSAPGCGSTEVITRTWRATDECDNFTECVQVITVLDEIDPVVESVTLVPVGKLHKKHGCYQVVLTGSDNCDLNGDRLTYAAKLNGHDVENGELVRLHLKKQKRRHGSHDDDDGCRMKTDDGSSGHSGHKHGSNDDDSSSADCGTKKFECYKFDLIVTATDDCDNVSDSVTAPQPVFAEGRSHDHDSRSHDHDSASGHKKDHNSDDDSNSGNKKKKGKKKKKK
jgi:hypothetical protein